MRYAAEYKDLNEPLGDFIKRKGGINACAARFTRRLGRGGPRDTEPKEHATCHGIARRSTP
jgi:hypothetical protein